MKLLKIIYILFYFLPVDKSLKRKNNNSSLNDYSLGAIASPKFRPEPVDIPSNYSPELAIWQLRKLLQIRSAEEAIGELVKSGEVRCPCHLAIGQEAIPVGISSNLNTRDKVFGGHRSHGHYLAQGGCLKELFAEILGKVSGCSKGMGGSMHLASPQSGFQASVPIVGATIPIAVGAAISLKFNREKDTPTKNNLSVTYFGDGSTEEGVFHESLNLAASQSLPVLFVCENNLFSSHLDISLRQPFDRISRFAEVQGVNFETIDGNNLLEVYNKSKNLISYIRETGKPAFLETVTYRWRGHVGPNEDEDVGIQRKKEDIKLWKKRDPIKQFKEALIRKDIISEVFYEELKAEINNEIEDAINFARKSKFPETSQLLESVNFS